MFLQVLPIDEVPVRHAQNGQNPFLGNPDCTYPRCGPDWLIQSLRKLLSLRYGRSPEKRKPAGVAAGLVFQPRFLVSQASRWSGPNELVYVQRSAPGYAVVFSRNVRLSVAGAEGSSILIHNGHRR